MFLRPYKKTDAEATAALFYNTVHTVNARDYSAAQLDAWAAKPMDPDKWSRSFMRHHALVAVEGQAIVGFADMDAEGYLDRLYVHKDFQRKGIATALCDALEAACPAHTFTAHASITAKPFFLRRGYHVLKEQQVIRRGMALTNFIMEKAR
jgi:putative acetyltransferase